MDDYDDRTVGHHTEKTIEAPVENTAELPDLAEKSTIFSPPASAPVFDDSAPEPAQDDPFFGSEPFYNETIRPRRRHSSFKRIAAVAVIVSVLGGGSLGVGFGVGIGLAGGLLQPAIDRQSVAIVDKEEDFSFEEVADTAAPETRVPSAAEIPAARGSHSSYADVIQRVEPSVVSITSSLQQQENLFGMESARAGSGSGILFHESDTKYYIVTNYHVVRNSDSVNVAFDGSEPIPAYLVGSDAHNDIAVIYVDKAAAQEAGVSNPVLATFGDSDKMAVGDVVLAIGNAFGEGNIATNGIVSAKNKTITIQADLSLTVLQTNAAINPGNSGGPLINLDGEVIGINTAKISETNIEGMGYSIPSNIAKPIIEDFMASVNRPYIGVQISTLTPEIASQYNLLSAGALVQSVVPDSPADKAGIEPMDIITGLNDAPVMSAEQLTKGIAEGAVGDVVEIKLIRDGTKNMTLRVTLEQRL
jgi:serine protease Do